MTLGWCRKQYRCFCASTVLGNGTLLFWGMELYLMKPGYQHADSISPCVPLC